VPGRRQPGAEDWEGTFVSRVRGRKQQWGLPVLTVFMIAAAILIALGALVATGRIDPARLLE
jgi:hypothetical protein